MDDLRGYKTILVFYPKDNTPGCTSELMQFRDLHDAFTALGYRIIGVSRDSIKAHHNFKAKLELPFELASDSESQLCQQFDVIKEKSLYGRKYMGIERSTFVLDQNANIIQEWRKVSVTNHAAIVLKTLTSSTL